MTRVMQALGMPTPFFFFLWMKKRHGMQEKKMSQEVSHVVGEKISKSDFKLIWFCKIDLIKIKLEVEWFIFKCFNFESKFGIEI